MRLLLDTHLLLWAATRPGRIPPEVRTQIESDETELLFSSASIWEIAIKSSLGRQDFQIDARAFRAALLINGYAELPITGQHAAAVAPLPPIHRDPFDRMLVAQAGIEGATLLTADPVVGQYPGSIRLV
ncbi:MAG: type II toxin-antitoxin system VapC family toxin [Burkholderiaceae bacterium]